jgi:uroporphyrinogen decarboxylase
MPLTSKERFQRMYDHREADRVPIHDSPWAGTIRRWQREGMPQGMDYRDPQYEAKTIEETDEYYIFTNAWGATMKKFKKSDTTPDFLDFVVKDSTLWKEAKKRMTVDESRLNLEYLSEVYPKWDAEGRWIEAGFWFGYDAAHSWMTGTETFLIAMAEEPEWVHDILDTFLDRTIAHFDMLWDRGYRFDAISWPDDMGYKGTAFFSAEMYRELIKPYHKRAVDWAHNKGIFARLHTCGNVKALLPDILDTGIDVLNPIEIKAGMDIHQLKKDHGDTLTLHGGINAMLWDKRDEVLAEIERTVPVLKENGGYIFASDHSIPSSVSLANMTEIFEAVKRVGAY